MNSQQLMSSFPANFVSLLEINNPPMDIQNQELLQCKAEILKKLSLLETKVRALDEELRILRVEEDVLKNDLNMCRIITSPIRRLPFDVLSSIFEYVPTTARPDPLQSPLLLCQVSREWRNTALRTPQLWRTLSIYIRDNDYRASARQVSEAKYKKMQSVATCWFARANGLSLNLAIDAKFQYSSLPYAQAFLKDVLMSRESDICSIELHSSQINQLIHTLLQYQPRFPKLSKVILRTSDRHFTAEELRLPGFVTFHNASNLKYLGCYTIRSIEIDSLPSYQSLACLILDQSMPVQEWVTVIRHFRQLRTGVFHTYISSRPAESQTSGDLSTVTLQNLKHLYLYHDDDSEPFDCPSIRSLEFPVLEDFRVSFNEMTDSLSMLFSKVTNIRKLAIRYDGTDRNLRYLSSVKTQLKDLEEFECVIPSGQFRRILELLGFYHNMPSSAAMFPRMKRITLSIITTGRKFNFPTFDLKHAIKTRWEAAQKNSSISPLQHITCIVKDSKAVELLQVGFDSCINGMRDNGEESVKEFTYDLSANSESDFPGDHFHFDVQQLQEEYQTNLM